MGKKAGNYTWHGIKKDYSTRDTRRWQKNRRGCKEPGVVYGYITGNRYTWSADVTGVRRRLERHGFFEPFMLSEDPKDQDARATWIEYLGYSYYWLDLYAKRLVEREEVEHGEALRELRKQSFIDSCNKFPAQADFGVEMKLKLADAEIQAKKAAIMAFLRCTDSSRETKFQELRQKRRIEWMLEQFNNIEAERKILEIETSTKDTGEHAQSTKAATPPASAAAGARAKQGKKRRCEDDNPAGTDNVKQQSRQKRNKGQGSSIAEHPGRRRSSRLAATAKPISPQVKATPATMPKESKGRRDKMKKSSNSRK